MGLHRTLLARVDAPQGWSRAPWRKTVPCSMAFCGSCGRAPWADLPNRYPSNQTCHAGFSSGFAPAGCRVSLRSSPRHSTTKAIWICRKRLSTAASRQPSREELAWERRSGARDQKIMAIADRQGLPVAVHVESATPHEVTLVHATLAERFVRQLAERLIGDNAYESDRLDAELARRGVELIAPHRKTRRHRTQDGRRCVATAGGGRSSDSLPGSRTFAGSSCATSDSQRTFSGCYALPAASFCCGFMTWLLVRPDRMRSRVKCPMHTPIVRLSVSAVFLGSSTVSDCAAANNRAVKTFLRDWQASVPMSPLAVRLSAKTQTFIWLRTIIPTPWRQRHWPRDCGERPIVSRLPTISSSVLRAGGRHCGLACALPCRP